MNELDNLQIVIVGLGYVGLPLAVEFGKKYPTLGVDINEQRIQELKEGFDRTRELEGVALKEVTQLTFTTSLTRQEIEGVQRVYIVTVPTPIDAYKKPDLSPLLGASRAVGKVLQKGDIVIYESTVYPGCTEEDCVPVLEKESGLQFNTDFYCGYSPERINPGDKENTLTKILKITSGSTPEIADFVDALYKSIIVVGTYKAPSMKVAEAAKIVENCQRYVNISLMNEFAMIYNKLGININDVLQAAGTKWNFHGYFPGVIGGPCLESATAYMRQKGEADGHDSMHILSASLEVNERLMTFLEDKMNEQNIKEYSEEIAQIKTPLYKGGAPHIENKQVKSLFKV